MLARTCPGLLTHSIAVTLTHSIWVPLITCNVALFVVMELVAILSRMDGWSSAAHVKDATLSFFGIVFPLTTKIPTISKKRSASSCYGCSITRNHKNAMDDTFLCWTGFGFVHSWTNLRNFHQLKEENRFYSLGDKLCGRLVDQLIYWKDTYDLSRSIVPVNRLLWQLYQNNRCLNVIKSRRLTVARNRRSRLTDKMAGYVSYAFARMLADIHERATN